MAAKTIHLDIVTPERKVLSAETAEVIAPGGTGLFGVRAGHAPFLTLVVPGELSFKTDNQTRRYAIGGGFVEVADDHVIVLAETAEAQEEIDLERAKRASEDALQRLASLTVTDPEHRLQRARVRRAAARIHVATKR
ncbi:MAG TPA: F0F1 ATP synthase subunit epsilon [Myxococcales bacterium]|jgi:F-type H+-transporting ATPase subunit epsilon